jgi:hypothetical protein
LGEQMQRVVKDAANWPTPAVMDTTGGSYKTEWIDGRAVSYHNHKEENPVAYGAKLSDAVKHGLPAPANPSTDGNRQGLSWPTPQTMDTLPVRPVEEFAETNKTRGGRKNRKALSNLREAVHSPVYQASWATPAARDTQGKRGAAANARKGNPLDTLPNQMAQWGTPTARDHKSGRGNEEREYKELTPMVERTQSGKLNPRWVETLMGLPIGWTMPSCTRPVTIEPMNCDCLGTESSQPPQNEHLELF